MRALRPDRLRAVDILPVGLSTCCKGDVLCVVGVPMFMSKTLRDAGEAAQQQRLGALCNKIFAAN